MIYDDSRGGGEIQTPNLSPNGNSVTRIRLPDGQGKTDRLLAEEQIIALMNFGFRIVLRRMAAEGDQPPLFHARQKCFKALVMTQVYLRPVIKPRPLQVLVVDFEAERVNQV